MLPALIADCETAARRRDPLDPEAAFLVLAEVYQATAVAMSKLRDLETAWIAGDRSMAAAALEPDVADGSPQLVAMWGALNQVAAVIATRADEEERARSCLRKAEEAAGRLPSDRNDFHTEFGRTNVALDAVSIAVELGDAGEALRRAAAIDASGLSAERRARFLLDVARAYAQRRKAADTVRTLEEAEAVAPEQVRSHPMVREMVRDLLRGERRSVNPALRALAQRVGVLPNPQVGWAGGGLDGREDRAGADRATPDAQHRAHGQAAQPQPSLGLPGGRQRAAPDARVRPPAVRAHRPPSGDAWLPD